MYRNGLKKDACVFFQNQFNMNFAYNMAFLVSVMFCFLGLE